MPLGFLHITLSLFCLSVVMDNTPIWSCSLFDVIYSKYPGRGSQIPEKLKETIQCRNIWNGGLDSDC